MTTTLGSTAAGGPEEGVEGLEAIMRRGGHRLRERMARTELHLERVTGEASEAVTEASSDAIRLRREQVGAIGRPRLAMARLQTTLFSMWILSWRDDDGARQCQHL